MIQIVVVIIIIVVVVVVVVEQCSRGRRFKWWRNHCKIRSEISSNIIIIIIIPIHI